MNKSIQNKVLFILYVIVVTLIIVIIFSHHTKTCEFDVNCVQTSEDAIKIADVICRRVYPNFNYEQNNWKCIYNDKESVWIVFYDTDPLVIGGGSPEIHIKKNNAEVTSILLTK